MLIVNDEQRLRAGIGSISKRCQYCSKALAAYPLILSDDAKLAVYHAVDIPTQRMVNTSWHSDWWPTCMSGQVGQQVLTGIYFPAR
jgi:hypothetical protein